MPNQRETGWQTPVFSQVPSFYILASKGYAVFFRFIRGMVTQQSSDEKCRRHNYIRIGGL
jgi:hypothetical protein